MTRRSLLGFLALFVAAAAVLPASTALAEPAECNDGIDNDADGLTDYPNDPGCSEALDHSETDPPSGCDGGTSSHSCPGSNLTLRYDRDRRAFVGAMGHPLRACVEGREVVVYRQRPGRDEALGSVLTTGRGNWRLDTWGRTRGRFYARAPERVVMRNGQEITCVKDRSVTIRLGR